MADLTVNTDFAQVEADEQQVNLTRFSLFFPEKREFFLENQGVFAFGGAGSGPFGGGGATPVLFYSRRIGLAAGDHGAPVEVPIHAGGRLTGRVGQFSVGALNMQTGGARNETYGLDGTFSFFDDLTINTYWAQTRAPERLETRIAQGRFGILFENSDRFNATYTRSYEFLERPFEIAPDVEIPVGGHRFEDVEVSYTLGQQRALGGALAVQHGCFYSGRKTSVRFGLGGYGGGRFELSQQLSVEPGFEVNRITLPTERFTTRLVTARTTYTVTPLMFVSALLQYNSTNNAVGANVRLRWEYQPGSELFVVYNEQRKTLAPRFPLLDNRAFIVKLNRLFRF